MKPGVNYNYFNPFPFAILKGENENNYFRQAMQQDD